MSLVYRSTLSGVRILSHIPILNSTWEAQTDVAARDKRGQTPLHYAVKLRQSEIVATLVSAGANNVKDNDGVTALHYAVKYAQWEEVTTLLGAGADIIAKDNDGMTALHYAVKFGHSDIVMALVGSGANNVKDNDGMTALHYAARYGRWEAATALLGAGADIIAKDNDGLTALHYAAKDGKRKVVKALVGAGADNVRGGKDGMTALHYAAQYGRWKVVKALVAAGVDINAKENDGWTVLHYAASHNRKDIVELLAGVELKGARRASEMTTELETQSEKSRPVQMSPITLSLNDVQTEADLLSKLASHYPTDFIFPRLLGSAFWNEKKYSQAISFYEKSIQLDPSNATAVRVDQIHLTNVICSKCKNEIFGIFYSCTECYDFDLCLNCYSKPYRYRHSPESSHEFLRIPSEGWSLSSIAANDGQLA